MLQYTITPNVRSHLYEVSLSLTVTSNSLSLYVPAWTSGSYLIRDYAGRFRSPSPSSGKLEQLSSNRWIWTNLQPGTSVTLTWQVFAYSEGIHDAWLDQHRGFINPAALLMIPDSLPEGSVHLRFISEKFKPYSSLTESTPHCFIAKDIQELLDAPFTLLPIAEKPLLLECLSHGISHRLLFTGLHSLNKDRLLHDVQAILDTTIDFWGSAPFKSYLFHIQMGPGLFGGLEHESSSVLQKDPQSLPSQFEQEMPADYDDFLRLLAHEYFHAWLVKFLRPEALLPYRLETPVHTQDLWVFEGLTSYYENLIPYRAGVIEQKVFLQRMSERFRAVREREGFEAESLAQSSFNAWTHLYKQTADSPYSQSSYYGKGAILAFMTDMCIRDASSNTHSLDDALRYWFRLASENNVYRALPTGGFPALIDSALDLHLSNLVHLLSTETDSKLWDQTWKSSLKIAGLKEEFESSDIPRTYLGLVTDSKKGIPVVRYARSDGPAFEAGLFAGDEIVAVNGLRTIESQFPRQIEQARGACTKVTIFRRNRLVTLSVNVPITGQKTIGRLCCEEESIIAERFKSTN